MVQEWQLKKQKTCGELPIYPAWAVNLNRIRLCTVWVTLSDLEWRRLDLSFCVLALKSFPKFRNNWEGKEWDRTSACEAHVLRWWPGWEGSHTVLWTGWKVLARRSRWASNRQSCHQEAVQDGWREVSAWNWWTFFSRTFSSSFPDWQKSSHNLFLTGRRIWWTVWSIGWRVTRITWKKLWLRERNNWKKRKRELMHCCIECCQGELHMIPFPILTRKRIGKAISRQKGSHEFSSFLWTCVCCLCVGK